MEASKSSMALYCCRCCLIALVVTSLMVNCMAFPQNNKYCIISDAQQEICQQCAKMTKSKYVYPMCCNEEDGVYRWCNDFVTYGLET